MMTLVLMICLKTATCDEATANAVWRKEMTIIQCEERLSELRDYVIENRLNPPEGYYKLVCRSSLPKA